MIGMRSMRSCVVVVLAAAVAPAGTTAALGQEEGKVDPAAKKLAAAGGLFQRSLFKLAAEEYAEFVLRYPKHARITSARYGLAVCYYRLKQYAQAARELTAVVADKDFKQADEALAVMGHCQLALKVYDKALEAFEQLGEKHPKSRHAESAALNRAQTLYMLKRLDDCRQACSEFLESFPDSASKPTAQYFQALSLRGLGKNPEAAAVLVELLKIPNCPYQIDALLVLGQCYQDQNKPADAESAYREMIKASPPARQIDGRYSLAIVLYDAKKYKGAIEECKKVLADPSGKYASAVRYQLGLAQWAAGEISGARETFGQVVRKHPERALQARYWLARCDMSDKKYDAARATLAQLRKDDPDGKMPNAEQIAYDLAVCSMSGGKFDQAAKDFAAYRTARPKGPKVTDTLYRQAFCLHKLKKYKQSQALCEKVARAGDSPVKQAAAELSAENLFLSEDYAGAEKVLGELIKTTGADEQKLRFSVRLGQCAYLSGDHARAAQVLAPLADKKQLAAEPALRDALLVLGDAQLQLKKYSEAAEALKKYLAVSKANVPEARYKLGMAYLRDGKATKAAKEFAGVGAGKGPSPWAVRAMFEYGQLAYQQGKGDDAAGALKKVVAPEAKAPADLEAAAMYLLAWIDLDARKYPEAAERFGAMAKKHPKHRLAGDAAFQQALCTQLAGQAAQALTLYRAYLKAHAGGEHAAAARRMSAQCLAETGKHGDAAKILVELAADKKAVSDEILYELAWSQRETKSQDAAVESYRRLIDEYPKSTKLTAARAELADLLYIKKEYKEAAELLEKVLADKSADAQTLSVSHYRLGWCYQKVKDTVKAAEAFTGFAGRYPKDKAAASALYQAGTACTELGKYDQAEKHFATLLANFASHDLARQAQIKLGQVQAEARQFDKSAQTFQAFLKKYPKDKLAYLARFGTGWAMEAGKKYEEARKWYGEVVQTHNGPTAARAQYQIGETWFAEEKYERAARELIAVDTVYAYPDWSARALVEAGRAFEAAKQPDKAKSQYALCIKKYPDSKAAALAGERLKAMAPEARKDEGGSAPPADE